MKVLDILIESIQQAVGDDPRQMREVLYFLIMEQALKSENLQSKKGWMTIGSLVAFAGRERRFPKPAELRAIKSSISSALRNAETRTSCILYSLTEYELGEHLLKKFLEKDAWKGLPGVTPSGKPVE
jgi:hypothetical protein